MKLWLQIMLSVQIFPTKEIQAKSKVSSHLVYMLPKGSIKA
jgi:hypothetical protein